jgi:dTDP-4-dehydrorhamnose reductase
VTVLVLGAAGQLGHAVADRFCADHTVMPCTRQDVDLTDHHALWRFVRDRRPEAIVNCAAYNHVDRAEDEAATALDVNAMAVRTLAHAAGAIDAVLVHISTDFVFAGTASAPYTESDAPEPQGVYAMSKLVGEWMAASWRRHYVVRVESLFGGARTRSSVDRIIDQVSTGARAPVFVDRIVSPSFVDDVAGAVETMVTRRVPYGLYHCVNTGTATWFEVGREIVRLLGRPESALTPVSVNDVTLRAPRPKYAALSNAKLVAAGITMPTWQDALARHLGRRRAS